MNRNVQIAALATIALTAVFAAGYVLWQLIAPSDPGTAGPTSSRRIVLETTADQLYALTPADLQTAGAEIENWRTQPIRLTTMGRPVPYLLQDDHLIFYGHASDSIYASAHPFILEIGADGRQMETVSAPAVTGTPQTAVQTTTHHEEKNVYVSNARRPGHEDTWYWHTVHVQQTFDFTIDIPAVSAAPATAELYLFGSSQDPALDNDHDLDLIINDRTITTIQWDGQVHYTATIDIPADVLQTGPNQFRLDNTVEGTTFVDIMQFGHLRLTHMQPAAAHNGRLHFWGDGQPVAASGFADTAVLVDVSNPAVPRHISDLETTADGVQFGTTADQHLILADPATLPAPDNLRGLRQTTLADVNNQADLLIVTTDALAPSLTPLIAARQAQGITTTVATVAELYDNFDHGRPGPHAIQNFVAHTVENWHTAPRYLLLVGTSSYDFRNYLGNRPANQVPSMMVAVTHSGETVSDARLADIDGDLKPDLAVGRWPVNDTAQVDSLIERTLAYEQNPPAAQTLFTADASSAEFTNLSDQLATDSRLPQENITKLYGVPTEEVAANWNAGSWLITYVGHGSLNLWGKDSLFTADAIDSLQNNPQYATPIVLQFTCLTGFFAHPEQRSLSERLLTADNGPVLLVGATSLTLSSSQRPFAEALLTNLQQTEYERIGDAMLAAKQALDVGQNAGLREVSDTFGLLGDPTTRIVRPEPTS